MFLLKCKLARSPLCLWESVVFLVLLVGVEVEDALDEVLREHQRVLQQQVHQAVLTKTSQQQQNQHDLHLKKKKH